LDQNIVIANRHVAELIAEASITGKFRFKLSLAGVPFGGRIDFKEEFGGRAAAGNEVILKSVKFIARSDQPDIALFQIEADGALQPPVEFLNAHCTHAHTVQTIDY